MPPVVTRTLRGCLALAALLISAWGQLRAAVEPQGRDAADPAPISADVLAPGRRVSQVVDATVVVAWTLPDAPATSVVAAAPAAREPICRAAPTPRRGSAGGPRAP